MIKTPVFKSGNASIRKALNEVSEYARRHGVNPAGRPGWIETADGWNPPLSIIAATVAPEYWGLENVTVAEGAAPRVKIVNPGVIKKTSAYDDSGIVTIVDIDDDFAPVDGDMLVLEVTPALVTTLKKVSTWTGYPYPIKTVASSPPGYFVLDKYYYLLYDFMLTADSTDPYAITVSDTLKAEKRGFNNHLQFVLSRGQNSTGQVISYFELVPAVGCRR